MGNRFTTYGFKSSAGFVVDGGHKSVRKAEFGFGESGFFAIADHVPSAGAHTLDVFGEIKRFGNMKVAGERSVWLFLIDFS